MLTDNNNNGFAIAGGFFGAAVGGSPFLGETFCQWELLRHIKKKKPLLKGDTFEYLQKTMDKESFDCVTKNKKLLLSPIFKKLGVLALFIAGGMFLGSSADSLTNKLPNPNKSK